MSDQLDIVYDAQCSFCVRVLRALVRLDRAHVLTLHASDDVPAVIARFPELASADLSDAMFAVSRDGVTRGYFAFKQIVRRVRLARIFLPLFYVPGADVAGPVIYGWIARHRTALGCEAAKCDRVRR